MIFRTKLFMKSTKLSLLFIFCISCLFTYSQERLIKISPFHFLDGTFYLSYEKMLKNDNSYSLSAGYNLTDNGDQYGWMGELQLRRYVVKPKINNSSDSPLAGIYAGIYANSKYFLQQDEWYNDSWIIEPYYDIEGNYVNGEGYSYEIVKQEYDIKQIEGGVLLGLQMIFSYNFTFDFFIGGGLRVSDIDNKPINLLFNSLERGYTGIVPKIGLELGINF